jgi:hypothetical protein
VYQWNNLASGYPNAVQATTANQPYTGLSNYNGLNTISVSWNLYNWVTFNYRRCYYI